MNKPNKQRGDFYTDSLTDQYKRLSKRIPETKRLSNFKDFIENLFPSGSDKNYTFSCPNFLKELHSIENGKTYLNNVVIRPQKTLFSSKFLPDGQNVILIGDISKTEKYKIFEVK